ncbi:GNAT family N-acetyltransferase [Planococcus halotolerans]|uniref:GNAT family N-acetyltransferase n=1 Tax=Planococcus halotolerans TaxID=2233542 RepID=UPI001092E9CE|nr:GNAT family protein [Planococcus halotolerans]QHJ70004.1 GNAT family N-acetyltransferase [Planococcus halotolerans]
MEILLSLLQESDAEKLLEFERVNRRFFEKMVPGRGDDYYQWTTFLERHRELLEEQERGVCRFYLVKDPDGNIAGRINLVDIDAASGTAEVGFRLGENYGGKGIGSKALSLLLSTESDLKQIHAKTTTVNKSSQRVLEKNGFIHMGISDDEFEMNGEKMRFVRYLWVSNER